MCGSCPRALAMALSVHMLLSVWLATMWIVSTVYVEPDRAANRTRGSTRMGGKSMYVPLISACFLLWGMLLCLLLANREIVTTHAFQQEVGWGWYGKTCESKRTMENEARCQHIIIITVWLVLQHFQEYTSADRQHHDYFLPPRVQNHKRCWGGQICSVSGWMHLRAAYLQSQQNQTADVLFCNKPIDMVCENQKKAVNSWQSKSWCVCDQKDNSLPNVVHRQGRDK